MALARLSVVKDLLGVSLTTTTYDDVIKNYINASTVAFESACDRQLEKAVVSEFCDTNDSGYNQYIYTKTKPIISIYAVSTCQALLLSTAYQNFGGDKILFTNGLPNGNYSTRISYCAGYDTTHWQSLGMSTLSTISYTGFISINAISVNNKYSFASAVAITKTSIPISIAGAKAFKWTTAKTTTATWAVPRDMEGVIAEDAAIQILKRKPVDGALDSLGEGRIGVVKINRGLYKGSTDAAEFEKYVEGFTARWKQCVSKYRSLWY